MGCRAKGDRPGGGHTLSGGLDVTDFVVIGGGIAGVSAAAYLAPHGSVTLLEMERNLAHHTTGRSAAMYVASYGGQGSRPLGVASKPFFDKPPPDSADSPLLSPRGLVWVADHARTELLDQKAAATGARPIDASEVLRLVPLMSRDWVGAGLHEPRALDIDVAGVHQAFVRIARRHDADLRTSTPVTGLARPDGRWRVSTPERDIQCSAVINASGAWGDLIAGLAGIEPIGLEPLRRTAFMVPGDVAYSTWPFVADIEERFYFRPDGAQLLCSLSEETPSPPTDPRPEMSDIALAIERINEATTLGIRSVNSQWTGLRTFAPDREMVIGEDPDAPGFFWLVGQGGTGIQTSPACGALIASLVTGTTPPPELDAAGVDACRYSPARFR
jgi:D-arginine dehydrogenase